MCYLNFSTRRPPAVEEEEQQQQQNNTIPSIELHNWYLIELITTSDQIIEDHENEVFATSLANELVDETMNWEKGKSDSVHRSEMNFDRKEICEFL